MKQLIKIFFIVLMMALATACNNTARFVDCIDGCSDLKGEKGDRGDKGDKGDKGDPGIPGTSCFAETTTGGINVICGSNPPVFLRDGQDGHDGATGPTGAVGLPGTSCSVTTLLPSHDNPTGGAQVTCGSSSAIVINGAAGADAAAYTIVGSIDPCGPSGGQDEVFLRMASGAVVALFTENSSALTSRLSYIKDGVGYSTTDTQHCGFNLTTNGTGVRTINYTTAVMPGFPLFESWQTY